MPAGIQVWNENGYLQFDSNFASIQFDRKQALTFSAGWDYGAFREYQASASASAGEIIAIHSPNTPVALMGVWTAAAAGTFTSTAKFTANGTSAPTGVVAYFFKATNPDSVNIGMEVRDASGNVTFTADKKMMRIYTIGTTSTITNGAEPANTTITTDASKGPYAAFVSMPRMGWMYTGAVGSTSADIVMDGVQTPTANTSVIVSPKVFMGFDYGTGWPFHKYGPLTTAAGSQGGGIGSTVFCVSVAGL